jgi:hypothetical protein
VRHRRHGRQRQGSATVAVTVAATAGGVAAGYVDDTCTGFGSGVGTVGGGVGAVGGAVGTVGEAVGTAGGGDTGVQ